MKWLATAGCIALTVAGLHAAGQTQTARDLAGRIEFRGAGVPGAVVTATKGNRGVTTVSDDTGAFRFANLEDGVWTLRIELTGFVPATESVTIPPAGPPITVSLTMKPLSEIVGASLPKPRLPAEPAPNENVDIIAGSSINGAASQFAQPRAFGNNRPDRRGLYNFGVNTLLGTSSWNARPFSFTGAPAPLPSYHDVLIGGVLGGPLRIPWVVKYGPQMMLGYEHAVSHSAITESALVPTPAERAGDFSQSLVQLRDPLTGQPFAGNAIPSSRISPSAAALLAYYPLPTGATADGLNVQAPVVSATMRDTLQLSMAHNVSRRTTMSGALAFQRATTKTVTLFDFEDRSRQSSLTTNLNLTRQVGPRMTFRLRYQLARAANSVTPFFAGRVNVSDEAGITGNDQRPSNWGPPAIVFPDIVALSDVERQRTVTTSHTSGGEVLLRRGVHNITAGGDVRWHRASAEAQPNPRGTLTFTGAVTGSPFGDFLLGVPSASAIAFGTTAVELRARSYDVYVNDDWRPAANVTLSFGIRWEYEAPFRETSGRLANLDLAPDFSTASVVTGPSLIRADKRGFQPRLAASWRPSLGSSLIVRASYGLYRNLGGYQSIALLLAGQPPFATTFSVQNDTTTPLTLSAPFATVPSARTNTIAIDPDFQPATAENWQVSVQRELPWSLTAMAAYLGARGTHVMQAFAPNTFPPGMPPPCAQCPSGFVYITSGGRSLRNAAQLTLRRRLYRGLTATAQYTIAKSTDNAATFSPRVGGPASLSIAQNWLDLDTERGPSSFDQRHLFTFQLQYTSGAGLTGGTWMDGRFGRLFKDWTVTSQLSAGSGLPFTPIYFVPVPGTGIVGIRPSLTGEPIATGADGAYANANAFTTPAAGEWGDARRNSLRGPSAFSLDASLARVFRLRERLSLEWKLAATNVLNRVTFSRIETIVTSPRFARPTSANPMRAIQMSARFRF